MEFFLSQISEIRDFLVLFYLKKQVNTQRLLFNTDQFLVNTGLRSYPEQVRFGPVIQVPVRDFFHELPCSIFCAEIAYYHFTVFSEAIKIFSDEKIKMLILEIVKQSCTPDKIV